MRKSRFATTRSFLSEQWFGETLGGGSVQFLFADHRLDTDRRELHRGAEAIPVEPQVLDLLICLVQNRNRVVTKDDLIASVWRGRIVSEATLTSRIYAARKAVGDSGQDQKLIRTIARKGLRFVGDVQTQSGCDQSVAAADLQPSNESRKPAYSVLPLPERPTIAVLPFDNMCGDPAQEYFSDGISEDIITALSKLRWFFVIARNSSFTYKGKAVHIKQVAEELGVSYVLEGSVRKLGERVRITAQLNDVATGGHIWAERYDRDLADVFAVQDEITEAIVAAIEPQIYAAENFRARRKPPESLDAWDLVMRALSHFWRVTRQDNIAAQELLERAIAIDPNYGQALGLLATSHIFGVHMGWSDKTVAPVAERAALAAIRADSDDPWAHHALGCTHLFGGGWTIRSPSSKPRCVSIPTSRWPSATTASRWPIAAAGRRPRKPFAVRCGSVRAIRCRRFTSAPPPSPSSSGATTTRRCSSRARQSGSAAISSEPAACSPPPPAWPDRPRSPRLRWRNCAAPSPTFLSPGSQTECRSSMTPTGNTTWKAFAAPAWTSRRPLLAPSAVS